MTPFKPQTISSPKHKYHLYQLRQLLTLPDCPEKVYGLGHNLTALNRLPKDNHATLGQKIRLAMQVLSDFGISLPSDCDGTAFTPDDARLVTYRPKRKSPKQRKEKSHLDQMLTELERRFA
jgi:hypothetical protein